MQIPNAVPCSLNIKYGSSQGRIFYELKSTLAVSELLKRNLKTRHTVFVHSLLRNPLNTTICSKEDNATLLCCLQRGIVSLQLSVNKNAFTSGETIDVHIVVDNSRSKLHLKNLSLKVKLIGFDYFIVKYV